jgi:transmembrane 9 superfamily member 2/4
VQEDYGWKLVHGEVFRIPKSPILLSVLVGNGAQLCAMIAVTLVFALFGFLSPSNRGALATVMLMCWTFFGMYV